MTGSSFKGMRRLVAAVLLVAMQGCYSMNRITARSIPQNNPQRIFVMDIDGGMWAIDGPQLRQDSLWGISVQGRDSVALALTEVEAIAVRQKNQTKTRLAIVGAVLGVGAVAGLAIMAADKPSCRPNLYAPDEVVCDDPLRQQGDR